LDCPLPVDQLVVHQENESFHLPIVDGAANSSVEWVLAPLVLGIHHFKAKRRFLKSFEISEGGFCKSSSMITQYLPLGVFEAGKDSVVLVKISGEADEFDGVRITFAHFCADLR